jgi:DNA-binding beta-propeller fold protein YncE
LNRTLLVLCCLALAGVIGIQAYVRMNRPAPIAETKSEVPKTQNNVVEPLLEQRVVAGSFHNPCGVAFQPETGHIFVSMIDRIVRVVPGEPSVVHDEFIGFPTDSYGKGPSYEFGPLGLAFADKNTLVVGDGGQDDGKEIVRVYSVAATPPAKDKVRKAEEMLTYTTPIQPGDDSFQGEGNFFGVAIHGSHVFVTSNGDDTKGWICKFELDPKKPAPLKLIPFIKSKELTDTNAPMGATISPDGLLVVSQMGSTNDRFDSLLTFYDPATGSMKRKLKTNLRDITGVAYSPKTGKLYGIDFSWAKPAEGGLFRLEIVGDAVHAVRLAYLERPTALAFAPTGKLYVTVLGSCKEGERDSGKLLVFEGL